MKCENCPKQCIERICGNESEIRISKVISPFVWEEPILSFKGTSAIFFSGCNMSCIYCQNFEISHSNNKGIKYTPKQLAELFEILDEKGLPVELITPSPYLSDIIAALKLYRPKTVIYNSSAYESDKLIKEILPYVDIFLPDFKYYSDSIAINLSKTPKYFETAKEVLKTMLKKPTKIVNGIMISGAIVRHLVLPGYIPNTINVLNFLKQEFGTDIFISLMSQYTPTINTEKHPFLSRKLTGLEYKTAKEYLIGLGFSNGFFQNGESAAESFIPLWD